MGERPPGESGAPEQPDDSEQRDTSETHNRYTLPTQGRRDVDDAGYRGQGNLMVVGDIGITVPAKAAYGGSPETGHSESVK